ELSSTQKIAQLPRLNLHGRPCVAWTGPPRQQGPETKKPPTLRSGACVADKSGDLAADLHTHTTTGGAVTGIARRNQLHPQRVVGLVVRRGVRLAQRVKAVYFGPR